MSQNQFDADHLNLIKIGNEGDGPDDIIEELPDEC